MTYTFGGLTAGASHTVRLHFSETKWTSAGSRVFNVLLNGVQVSTGFDIFAAVGANKALVRDFTATATSAGQLSIQFVSSVDNAKVNGIEINANAAGSNQAPTVAVAAGANPSSVPGKVSTLSVLGADDGGESNLTYTWAATGTPPGSVSFSVNGSNAAKTTQVTLGQAGSYSFAVTIRDASGASIVSSTSLSVSQTATSVSVTPATAQVPANGRQQFAASLRDQFDRAMATQPTTTWSVSGGGTISSLGLFSAGSVSGGPFTVSATSGGKTGSAAVVVSASGSGLAYRTDFGLTENPISEGGVWTTGKDPFQTPVRTSNGLAYGTQNGDEWATGKTYNDSDAYLSGFANQHRVNVTIHRAGTPIGDLEIEVLLGWRVGAQRESVTGPTHSDGIEVAIGIGEFGQFLYVSRFFPEAGVAAGDFSGALASAVGDVRDGDIFMAELTLDPSAKPSPTGTVHTTITRGSKTYDLGSVTDASLYQIGQPGIGFFRQTRGSPDDPQMFCWSDFSAVSL